MNILIVEDDEPSLYLLNTLLHNAGHDTHTAVNGRDALDLVRSLRPFDLVVTDALMPTMDGFELCHAIRADRRVCATPLVIYTATFTADSDARFALDVGADRFLVKPIEPEILVPLLEQTVAQVRAAPARHPITTDGAKRFFEDHSRQLAVKLESKIEELRETNTQLTQSRDEVAELNRRLLQTVDELKNQVSERTRVAEELRLANTIVGIGSFGYDYAENLSWWTAEALEHLGLAPDSKGDVWNRIVDRIPVGQRAKVSAILSLVESQETAAETEFSLRFEGGHDRHLLVRCETFYDENGAPRRRLGVIRNITARRKAEAERNRFALHLEQSRKMEAIGNLAGGIAHDFNNILTIIFSSTELLKMHLRDFGDARVLSEADMILDASMRARDLISQILLFSRNETVARAPRRLDEAIASAAKLIPPTLPPNVKLELQLDVPNAVALINENQIGQIVINLAGNARHAIGRRPGTITLSLTTVDLDATAVAALPPLTPGAHLRLDVCDNGCGMDDETVRRIFEPFFTTKSTGEGTGLGLSVVHGIMHSHEGAITAHSVPGKGTTFSLFFPRTAADADQATPPTPSLAVESERHLVVVDDEPAVASVTSSLLEKLGYRVHTFTESTAARDYLLSTKDPVDLVVTDYLMPRLNGLELAKAVWARNPELPMIMVVGFGGGLDDKQARKHGFRSLVSKPYTQQTLAAAAAAALAKA